MDVHPAVRVKVRRVAPEVDFQLGVSLNDKDDVQVFPGFLKPVIHSEHILLVADFPAGPHHVDVAEGLSYPVPVAVLYSPLEVGGRSLDPDGGDCGGDAEGFPLGNWRSVLRQVPDGGHVVHGGLPA